MQAGAATVTLNSARNVVINNGVTGTIDTNGNAMTVNGVISGQGGLTKVGAGTLGLSGNSTYAGSTVVNQGTLQLGAGSGLSGAVNNFGGSGTGWTMNGGAAVANNVLTLTDRNNGEARTAFYNTPVPVNGQFTANFTYQDVGGSVNSTNFADGAAFILQNAGGGATAIGGGGGGFGYAGMTPSAAIEFNVYTGHTIGTNYATGGATGTYNLTGAVNVSSGDPINVTVVYNGSTQLTETLTDATTLATYSTTYTVGSLATTTGGNTAYVGFGGGTGGLNANQTISNFNFSSGAVNILPVATPLTVAAAATVDLNGSAQQVASLADGSGGGGTLINSAQYPATLTVSPTGTLTAFSGTIQGGGAWAQSAWCSTATARKSSPAPILTPAARRSRAAFSISTTMRPWELPAAR